MIDNLIFTNINMVLVMLFMFTDNPSWLSYRRGIVDDNIKASYVVRTILFDANS